MPRARSVLVVALLAWHGAESMRIRPHYLSYFNALAGGPENGWRHLVDSSLDWGQDLPGLAEWLAKNHPAAAPSRAPVFLSYFGTGDPAYEGVVATPLPSLPDYRGDQPWRPLEAGLYCISATMLQQVYSEEPRWTPAREKEFQELHAYEPTFFAYQNDATRRAQLLADFPAERWRQIWKRYERLRFARLCAYLKMRGPDAEVGYSILIFRLSQEEITAATAAPLRDWPALLEKKLRAHGS